jgi:hypothetical protein
VRSICFGLRSVPPACWPHSGKHSCCVECHVILMAEEVKLLGQIHALSMPSAAPLQLASHCPELLIVPILDAIRASLLQLRPSKDAEYNQFPDLVRRGIEYAISSAAAQHVLSAGQVPPSIDRSAQPSADFAVAHVSAVIERPLEDVPRPIHAPPPGSEAAESKFATFVHPSGTIEDYQKGLSSRIGFPHLQFYSAMEAEHSSMAGTSTPFTTRNYGITTTPQMEWLYVVHGDAAPAEHMLHGRSIARVEDKLQCCQARKAGLRKEEVIAIILYTGPNVHHLQQRSCSMVEPAVSMEHTPRWRQPLHRHVERACVGRSKAECHLCDS